MTHFAPLDCVHITDRVRRTFDEGELLELRESIERGGLLHAVVLRETPSGDECELHLVAGERRLRAVADLYEFGGTLRYNGQEVPEGCIPYTTLGELSPVEALEVEIEENTRRADLTWQERAKADARLLELRTKQAALEGKPAPTAGDIAQEVHGRRDGSYQTGVRENVILAKHLDVPEVRKAATAKEAIQILKRRELAERNAAFSARLGPEVRRDALTLVRADTREWLKGCDEGVFDVILTDPPYGMGADSFGDSNSAGTASHHGYEDDEESWRGLMDEVLPELGRVAAEKAHLYFFCDFGKFDELHWRLTDLGWKVHRTPLIWFKPSGFRVPWPEHGPQRKYETILYAIKGNKPTTGVKGDVLQYGLDTALGWAAQKPVELYIDLLKRSVASPGARILDPFCGTGPIFAAAHALECEATGVENNEEAYGIAGKRLEDLKGKM